MHIQKIESSNRTQFIDITSKVNQVVKDNGVKNGICIVFVPHTTAAITVNENADPAVCEDILKETNKIISFYDGYKHIEGNSAAHIKSSLYGPSETFIIEGGNLNLGTWQGIYFCEFDGPRSRKVYIKIISE